MWKKLSQWFLNTIQKLESSIKRKINRKRLSSTYSVKHLKIKIAEIYHANIMSMIFQ